MEELPYRTEAARHGRVGGAGGTEARQMRCGGRLAAPEGAAVSKRKSELKAARWVLNYMRMCCKELTHPKTAGLRNTLP